MQVRLIRKLAGLINGIDLSHHRVGDIIALSPYEAGILVAEGWAERLRKGERHARVLVVEDDEPLREYYRTGLAGRFVIDECADGMSALGYFDRCRPDAVVLDLNLPGLHGVTLYNELRGQPLTAGIPIVVVTGVDPAPILSGAVVLRKPCDIDVLIDTLELAMTFTGS